MTVTLIAVSKPRACYRIRRAIHLCAGRVYRWSAPESNHHATNTKAKQKEWQKIAAAPLSAPPPTTPPEPITVASPIGQRLAVRNGMGDAEMMRRAREVFGIEATS